MLEEIGIIRTKVSDYYHCQVRLADRIWIELIISDDDFDRADKNEIIPITEKISIPRLFHENEIWTEKRHRFGLSASRTAYIIDLDDHYRRLSISKFQKKQFDLGQKKNIAISEVTQPPTPHEDD
ncbi:hypothetical protein [Bacteroides sp.]|uniref:hypothetical protein n=1 Tax=Bacteroides sp. TaxID=29523 RepID=UPI002631ED28|nr:hypothetical protein [Bacteroides sp.]MDD3041107.1 hypothetical protein [Bacteroides sp.]